MKENIKEKINKVETKIKQQRNEKNNKTQILKENTKQNKSKAQRKMKVKILGYRERQ